MTAEKNRVTPRRARTEADREGRRTAILQAASDYLEEVGFDAVSMNGLAQRSGLAKGTLYLYFKTREEVMVALYLERLELYRSRVLARLEAGIAIAEAFIRAGEEDPAFLALTARLSSVIEQNLPRDVLISTKRATMRELAIFTEALGRRLDLDGAALSAATLALMSVLQGAALGSAIQAPGGEPLPEDVRTIFEITAFRPMVENGFAHILSGIAEKK